MIDYHVHLERGPLDLHWLKKFWAQAEARGLQEIAITEHAHRFKEFYPVYSHLISGSDAYPYMKQWITEDFKLSLADYFRLLEEARAAGIPVRSGIEVDYFEGKEDYIRALLEDLPFDLVLGAVHVLGKWGFDFCSDCGWSGRDTDEVYREYIAVLKNAVQAGLFDCMAHLDVIKVFGHRPTRDCHDSWVALFEIMARQGLAMEISTAGLRKPVGEIYPAPALIAIAAQYGIPITIASDAHEPGDVGYKWEEAVALARNHGYKSITVYSQRQPRQIPF
ncbi:MAG: histidinol-phosphatase HisJ family protein [Firmicutes bacterium]|jgi:histidinol-phosphatase (PHP family)|nr:histidinol-phosphatase HisJ family protein [Bacillota bacterium]